MIHQLRLDDLLARETDIRWFEAVAVIQAVCRQGITASAATADFPGAHDIVLDAAGTVSAPAVGVGAGAAVAAAHLLAMMLKEDVPVRLRLIVTQATAGVGCSTLEEFCEAVGYFERPDGEQVLKGLFERASRAPIRAPSSVHQDQTTPAKPLPAPERPERRRRSGLAAVGVAAIVLACGLVSWLIASRAGSTRLMASISGSDRRAEADGAPVAESSTRRPERVRSDARSAHATETGGVKPSTVTRSPRVRSERPATPLATTSESFAVQAPRLPSAMVFYSSVEIIASAAPTRSEADEPAGARIYTTADSAVTPPRSIYPRLPDEPPPGSRLTSGAVLELVIATTGLVEHVKLRTAPRNIHEFMIVSAAKAWQFAPARLDGQPVRFRQLIHFSMQ